MPCKYKMSDEETAFIEEIYKDMTSPKMKELVIPKTIPDNTHKMFREEQIDKAKGLLLNITELLSIEPFNSYLIDVTFSEIFFIYEEVFESMHMNINYKDKFRHIKPIDGIQSLEDDLYECTYLMIKCLVYDEVDTKMQDMVICFILAMSNEEEILKDIKCH